VSELPEESNAARMREALALAEAGRYGASPNPLVGALVVSPDGQVVGRGAHRRWGGDHAEVEALRSAGQHARGGTLYVTLEPCTHQGKTPPCVDQIIAAGIRRTVIAMADPNPAAAGGAEVLRRHGIVVVEGVLADAARRLNRRWLTLVHRQRPWIALKAAVTLDGRIATRTGESQWITGEPARRRGLELREELDAILVGVGTVLADDPRLTRRLRLNPVDRFFRIVLDSELRTPETAQLIRAAPESVVLLHTDRAPEHRRQRLTDLGVSCHAVNQDTHGRVSVAHCMGMLASIPVGAVLVEGGASVHGAFVDGGLVDETFWFVAPRIVGGDSASAAVGGTGHARLAQALQLQIEDVERHGEDLEIHAVSRECAGVYGSD
jgi:diaminohydroxyphosphoribosylaminopyrimidine deaminase/5-amino-6-(5-phosphoribosylamino)uracil reductase